MNPSDPRLAPARRDLASSRLEGLVRADRYVRPTPLRGAAPVVGIRRSPAADGEQLDQLLYGEAFDALEVVDGWAWGQARRDGYVGFVPRAALGEPGPRPTHRVAALRAYGFSEPDIRSPAAGPLSINSLLTIGRRRDRFVLAEGLGWLIEHQLMPLGRFETDFVAVAERFVGAAYLWGGREAHGVDCSGLVQQALLACGRACPRDADQQRALGAPAPPDRLRRGDLVFWEGHVAIMVDAARVVHANAHHAAVVIEPLRDLIARNAVACDGGPSAYRRL